MSDDEWLYRVNDLSLRLSEEMNPEDLWNMGISDDHVLYDSDEIKIDDLTDWD